jgi:hypothetical protein
MMTRGEEMGMDLLDGIINEELLVHRGGRCAYAND